MRTRRHPAGVSVIEVMIALGIAVIIVISVGSLIISTHNLDTEAKKQLQATGFAKQWLEVVDVKRNDYFGCTCGSSPACQLPAQRQAAGYTSCWTQDLGSVGNSGPFHVDPVAGLQPNADAPAAGFTRSMKIENQLRDVTTDELGSGLEDPSTKRITVTVEWLRAGTTRKVELSEIVTAWKNF